MNPKLVYILPEYDEKTATHFAHIYDFSGEIEKVFELYVVAERGRFATKTSLRGVPSVSRDDEAISKKGKDTEIALLPRFARNDENRVFKRSYVLLFSILPLRFLETFIILLKLRFKGYRDFYVHYSFLSAFLASIIVRIFGGRVYYWNCGEPWKYRRNIFREMFEKLTYKIITYLVTGTESLKKEYSKHYNFPLEKIKVMPNWINLSTFNLQFSTLNKNLLKNKLNIKADEKIILFVHRLSKRKGAHYLPEIIKAFKDEKVVFVVIGDGPERSELELRIKNYELGERVRMLGWVPNNELLKYYAVADIFLMPSDEEGFPRVLLEAMATKVPFVASDVGGVKEIIPTAFLEYVCSAGDINCFSAKIKKLLSRSREDNLKLREVEYDWVKKFEVSVVVERFKSILD